MPIDPGQELRWEHLSDEQKGALIYEWQRLTNEGLLAQGKEGIKEWYELQGMPLEEIAASYSDPDWVERWAPRIFNHLRSENSELLREYETAHQNGVLAEAPAYYTDVNGGMIQAAGNAFAGRSGGNNMATNGNTSSGNVQMLPYDPRLPYDPNRGVSQADKDWYTGVRPGASIDIEKYGRTPEEQAHADYVRDYLASLGDLDPNRFAIDTGDLLPVDTFTYDPALAAIYGVDPSMSFDETRAQLDYANALNAYAADVNGTYLGEAAALQAAAARGESPLFADARLQRDAERMFQQQMMAAARARGSSSAGLAARQAMNNSMFGLGQLTNDANAARVQEMNLARDAYANTGATIRQGDLAAAGQAADIGQLIYGINNAELGADMFNTDAMNRGALSDQSAQNEAAQFNVGQSAAAGAANSQMVYNTLTGNMDRAMGAEERDRAYHGSYVDRVTDMDRDENSRRILGEQNFNETVQNEASRLANVYTGNATNVTQLTGQREAAAGQRDAAMVGAIGSVVGALGTEIAKGIVTGSDERMKETGRRVKPADFTDINERHWMYNEKAPPHAQGKQANGGMADEYPEDVVVQDENGMKYIDHSRLLMRQAGALGDIQRRLQKAGL